MQPRGEKRLQRIEEARTIVILLLLAIRLIHVTTNNDDNDTIRDGGLGRQEASEASLSGTDRTRFEEKEHHHVPNMQSHALATND